ncbi:MAG: hypothetical protein IPK12_19715 [Gemmatimonadetes bacterium]|nr:hypothetical protein [Gemmatimonadota bacterium]
MRGIFLALLNLTTTEIPWPKQALPWRRYHPAVYALLVALVWTYSSWKLAQAYMTSGQDQIPLGLAGLAVPSLLIVASYIGSLTCGVQHQHAHGGLPAVRQRGRTRDVLRTYAGRLLVALYVALVAFVCLEAGFPSTGSAPWVLFLGFFTGLWIDVVLETVNDLGKRWLSDRARARERELQGEDEPPVGEGGHSSRLGEEVTFNNGVREVRLRVDRGRIAVRFRTSPLNPEELAGEFGLVYTGLLPSDGYYLFKTANTTLADYKALVTRLEASPKVTRVQPVFEAGGGAWQFATDKVVLSLAETEDALPKSVEDALEHLRGTVLEVKESDYTVRLDSAEDPFKAATTLGALAEVEFAEPDLVQVKGAAMPYAPALGGDAEAGALAYRIIGAMEAWELIGDRALDRVTVAVLDDGVDRAHPDLRDAVGRGGPVPDRADLLPAGPRWARDQLRRARRRTACRGRHERRGGGEPADGGAGELPRLSGATS